MELKGLHHVTAVTGRARQNLDFYTRQLGLRLVKKTVNQDDVSAYHLFYGDEAGHAGTEVTFFDWPQTGPNSAGSGAISAIGLRVPNRAALEWWSSRLTQNGIAVGPITDRAGRSAVAFGDPEGQRLLLVDDGATPGGTAWRESPVPADQFIKGLDSVTLTVRRLEPTASVLTGILGMRRSPSYEHDGREVAVFEMGDGGPGAEVHVEERRELPPVRVGAGGVHHVAFRTPSTQEQLEWVKCIRAAGLATSQVIDRYYFQSVYFREPGGVLFEIATDGPGFATDETLETLGQSLSLPPFLEPRRAEIEAELAPLE